MMKKFQSIVFVFLLLFMGCSPDFQPTNPQIDLHLTNSITSNGGNGEIFFSKDKDDCDDDKDDDDCDDDKEQQLNSISFDKMIDCLGLTPEQKAALKNAKKEHDKSCNSSKEQMNNSKKKSLKKLNAEEAKHKSNSKKNTVDKNILENLKKQYKDECKKADTEYKSDLKSKKQKFLTTLAGILNADQLAKLNLWLAGKDPCATTNTGGTGSGSIGTGTGTGSGDTGSGDTGSGGIGSGIGTGG
jgi:hypothetical protein